MELWIVSNNNSKLHNVTDKAHAEATGKDDIKENGVAIGMSKDGSVVKGMTAIEGLVDAQRHGTGGIDVSLYLKAFNDMGAANADSTRIMYHDHSEYGGVITDDDIQAAKRNWCIVVARRGTQVMMYIPRECSVDGKSLFLINE
jgi:hypothetical protein